MLRLRRIRHDTQAADGSLHTGHHRGLCQALVRNYLNNVGKGKEIEPPVMFQGGVAANKGIKAAFEAALGMEVVVPPNYGVMGAVGAALLAQEHTAYSPEPSRFKGFEISDIPYNAGSFECKGCANRCEVVEIKQGSTILARWGDRCGKWQ